MYLKICDALVMGHAAPDADSLCSCLAIARFLIQKGKRAFVFINKYVPPHLEWLVNENTEIIVRDVNDSFCRNANFLYVLDCAPTAERTGFPIDKCRHQWFNIDHHADRFSEFQNKYSEDVTKMEWLLHEDELGNTTYLGRKQAASAILADERGFRDAELALGIYCDTVSFSLAGVSHSRLIQNLDITDERFEDMIAKTRFSGAKAEFDLLMGIKTWWSSDSVVCVVYDPSNLLDKGQVSSFVRPYCQNLVCLSKSKNVSLRSNRDGIDMSKIAGKYGGGGHKGASGFKMKQIEDVYSAISQIYETTVGFAWSPDDDDSCKDFLGCNNKNAPVRVFLGI